MEIESSVLINRSVADVFAFVGNPDRDMEWGTLIEESEKVTPGDLMAGSVFQQKAVFLGIHASIRLEVTAYEPHSLMECRVVHPVSADHRRTFEETPEGTRLTFYVQVDPPRQYQLGVSIMRRRALRQMESDMYHIKDLMETSAPGLTLTKTLDGSTGSGTTQDRVSDVARAEDSHPLPSRRSSSSDTSD